MGKIVSLYPFEYGYAQVKVEMEDGRILWGIINPSGDYVIEPKYDYICALSNGYFLVDINTDDKSYGDGEYQPSRKGVINKAGEVVVPIIYCELHYDCEEKTFTALSQDGRWGIIDFNNNVILPFYICKYLQSKDINGLHIIEQHDGKHGAIDASGKVFIPFIYDDLNSAWHTPDHDYGVESSYYAANIGDDCFFIDRTGKRVLL